MHIFRHLLYHRISPIIEDEDEAAVLFIEPHGNCASEEDSADEDDGNVIDNLSGNQLNASAKVVFSDGRQITAGQDQNNSEAIAIDKSYKKQIGVYLSLRLLNLEFPEANYSIYRNFSHATF